MKTLAILKNSNQLLKLLLVSVIFFISSTVNAQYFNNYYSNAITNYFATANILISASGGLIDSGVDITICEGDTAILTATGGTTYVWNTGDSTAMIIVSPAVTTTYIVTGAIAIGGSGIDTVIVTVNPAPFVDAGSDTTICYATSAVITATGGPPYLWNTGHNVASFTTPILYDNAYFVVTVTDTASGCASSDTVWVFLDAAMVDIGPDTSICAQSKVLDAGVGFTSYLWSTGDTTQIIIADTTGIGYGTGTFTVTVTSIIGCVGGGTIDITFVDCTGLEEISSETSVKLYPNPTKGKFQIDISGLKSNTLDMCVVNMAGQIIFYEKLNNVNSSKHTKALDFSNYPKGFYFIRLTTKDHVLTEKIIIQ